MRVALQSFILVAIVATLLDWAPAGAQAPATPTRPNRVPQLAEALSAAEWERVDRGVEKALAWLATQQQPDGAFPTLEQAQPAVTSLCVLAFLSDGHKPGEGKYGPVMDRAIDFVLKCQRPDGLFSFVAPEERHIHRAASHTASYNHAIAGLMLTQVHKVVSSDRATNIDLAIDLALGETKRMQGEPPKTDPRDKGGWRYLHPMENASSSDLSVTAWQMKFLRSAKKAGFSVPDEMLDAGVAYIDSLWQPERGEFFYGHQVNLERYATRGVMGAAILTLTLAGKKDAETVRRAADWIVARPFDVYHQISRLFDRFHYSAYYCSNAMAQLGGDYWKKTFPALAKTLLDAQAAEGQWQSESGLDSTYGPCYPTAMSVLSLTPAYQLLPIYQR